VQHFPWLLSVKLRKQEFFNVEQCNIELCCTVHGFMKLLLAHSDACDADNYFKYVSKGIYLCLHAIDDTVDTVQFTHKYNLVCLALSTLSLPGPACTKQHIGCYSCGTAPAIPIEHGWMSPVWTMGCCWATWGCFRLTGPFGLCM